MAFAPPTHWFVTAGLASLLFAGCSLHLHRPADEKQARAAADAYDKIVLDTVVKTGRANAAEIDKAEQNSVQQLTELVVRRDLAAVISQQPVKDPVLPLGWFKLIAEVKEELGPLEVLDPTVLKMATTSAAQENLRRLRDRIVNREYAASDRAKLDLYVRTYKSGRSKDTQGTQPTRCDYPRPSDEASKDQIQPPDKLPKEAPPDEPVRRWRYYVQTLAPECQKLLQAEAKADVHTLMLKDEEYKELTGEIDRLENQLAERGGEAKRLMDKYIVAKTALEAAEAKVGESTREKQTEKATAALTELQKNVGSAAEALASAVAEAKKVPFIEARIKTDLLAEVIANFQALGGNKDAPAHAVTKQFLSLLQQDHDVAGRLRGADPPPVNVLLLELAIQRLASQRLTVERDKIADELSLLRARRDLRIERAAAWLNVLESVQNLTSTQDLERSPLVTVYAAKNDAEKKRLAILLTSYAKVRLKYDVLDATFALQMQHRELAYATDLTEVSLTAWRDFIRAPLQEVATYHEGGLRSEDFANLIHALGLGAIAVGVNR